MNKLQITIACGGVSTEHAISIISAKNVIKALDRNRYDVSVLYIAENSDWYLTQNADHFIQNDSNTLINRNEMIPIAAHFGKNNQKTWQSLTQLNDQFSVDCVIPILHGTEGEDGAIQGLFELLGLAYVGSNVLGSALCMDKEISRRLLRETNITAIPFQSFNHAREGVGQYACLSERWKTNSLFVKAASLGSSVGIYKINSSEEFDEALLNAFKFDQHVIVEPTITGREIECAVLGNEEPRASLPGEIILNQDKYDFYSYTAKYEDPDSATFSIPADLPADKISEIQMTAVKVFKTLRCSGMARVDFILQNDQTLFVSEVNTIPGFTTISLYPKMWEASGLGYSQLLDELIRLAIEKHQKQNSLIRVYTKEDLIARSVG